MSPLLWRVLWSLKLLLNLALAGVFLVENSFTLIWRILFTLLALAGFIWLNMRYLRRSPGLVSGPNSSPGSPSLLPILLLDFLVSASYGYIYVAGRYPNHLFVGITALAILLLTNNLRKLIAACILLLTVYLTVMGTVDWLVDHQLDGLGYFTTCSFIVFAGIVSAVIQFNRRAREETMQLYAELRASYELLEHQALQAEELAAARERVRIARDIHDSAGHKLTALLVQMQTARKLRQSDALRSERIALECEELARSTLQEIRLSVRAIRDETRTPAVSAALADSLRKLTEEFDACTGVQTDFVVIGETVPLPGTLQLTAYRIVQESLTNAHRHGQAKHVQVTMVYTATEITLTIRNDGRIPAELKPGFGLIGMQERVKEWNGGMNYRWDRQQGFAVDVQLPYISMDKERVSH